MTVSEDLERSVRLMTDLVGVDNPTKELKRAQALLRLDAAESVDIVARSLLFERVHALRLRGFNQLFRGAEINMHVSLSSEMIG